MISRYFGLRRSVTAVLFECFLLPSATMASSDSDRDLEFVDDFSDRFVRTF
jgi:hypothetical protein